MPNNDNTLFYVNHTQLKYEKTWKFLKSSNKIIKLIILWIWKIQLGIMEENQHHLYIASEACKGNFMAPNFWFLFWSCLEKWIHLVYRTIYLILGVLIGGAFRTMIYCVHYFHLSCKCLFFLLFGRLWSIQISRQ